ncbi:MAG: efflux transporter outer membrane subunit [Candidatus Hydrogenedentes bacterium]|nr:efflux transporter outer membrane subunit [Candidatus Hydrogenedentota bacterium]
MRIVPLMTLAILAALLSGCMVGPDYKAPDLAPPEQWSEPLEGGASANAPTFEEWWAVFGDEMLNSLVKRAAAGSYDLRAVEARLREVRTYEDVAGAALWPQVNANAAYQRSQTQEIETPKARKSSASVTLTPNGLAGVSISRSPFGSAGPSFTTVPDLTGEGNSSLTIRSGSGVSTQMPDRQNDLYRAGFDATWELDVFGGIRREMEASRADTQSVEELRRDVLVSVAAEVARNYFILRSSQNRLEIANKNIDAQTRSLDLARSRFERGLTSELDVKFAEAELASSKSVVPSLEASIQWAIHRLGVLIGSTPGALQEELAAKAPLAKTPPEVPVGLPVDIIRHRPDVRSAERAIAAATARIGAAKADLYPHFVLTGSLTGSSSTFDGITRGANTLWSFGPGIRWPVFDGGRIRANIRVQDARQEQAIVAYEQTVMLALEEVENALVAYAKEQNRLLSLREAVEANRRALEIAKQLYDNGLVNFLNVIDAERSLFANEDQLTQSETVVLTNLVALYKALGGGWEQFYPEQDPAEDSIEEGQEAPVQ